jgi:uncharacterized membrane protein YphA (DoxX/SURF4 family)
MPIVVYHMKIWIDWILRTLAAVILLQTLFFKFTGAEESKFIFESIGAEPVGRIGSGVVELIAAVLLLIPAFAWVGALLAAGVMVGAIGTHLFVIGIEVANDGGTLFGMAVIVFVASIITLFLHRRRIPLLGLKAE